MTSFTSRESLQLLFSNNEEKVLLSFKHAGYLHDIGWVNSIATQSIIDVNNKPLPWVTYPFISFINTRINKSHKVFEFGSGNSTLYYAARAGSVYSVENDEFWYNKIKNTMPANVTLYQCELIYGGEYSQYALKTGSKFDVVIVDGRDRVNCCKNSIDALITGGVIVLDDSERDAYQPGIQFLTNKGFKRLDFWGIAPNVDYQKCTTIFYKSDNCLNI